MRTTYNGGRRKKCSSSAICISFGGFNLIEFRKHHELRKAQHCFPVN